MLSRDHYATLGVPPNASDEDIEEAYRHLSRRYHPDVNPGDPHAAAVFERIEEAYDILSDPERRERYDQQGSLTEELVEGDLDLRVRILPDSDDRTSFADLIHELREHARRSRPSRGEDIHVPVTVPLSQAERGRRTTVEVRRRQRCSHCSGRGRVQLQKTRSCERCNGVGEETFVKGALSVTCSCSECGGEGLIAGIDCRECRGSGLESTNERLLVRVPAGVRDGQAIRIPGAGHAGPGGGPSGDLVARVRIETPDGFRREGPHVHTTVKIGIVEAILGDRVAVPTLEGEDASLKIPPRTQSGRVFRLRERGLEMPEARRGDMLVRVEVRIPETVDEDTKQLIRKLAHGDARPRVPAPESDA